MDDLYFCIKLTEAEHQIGAEKLKEACDRAGVKLVFWRKLIDGHVPMFREVKVQGTQPQLDEIKKFIRDQQWLPRIERNPWR